MAKHKNKRTQKRSILESCNDPSPDEVYAAALAYRKAGLSFIPISADREKRPASEKLPLIHREHLKHEVPSWAPFKDRQPTTEEIAHWFLPRHTYSRVYGIAIVCGKVSGGLEVIDLDTFDLVEPFKHEVEKRAPGLFEQLVSVKSPRPGLHLYYRCRTIGGNEKLARCWTQEDGKAVRKTLIETKGEGGYVLAPPSPDWCHPREACYLFENNMDLTMIPIISPNDRKILLDSARVFNTYTSSHPQPRRGQKRSSCPDDDSLRPGDDFNRRAAWADILEPHDWVYAGVGPGGEGRWTRPGKSEGTSATTNHADTDLLYVFTQNADPFEADTAYTKFHAYTLLEHDGDFEEAARELCRRGYGNRRRPLVARSKSNILRSTRLGRKFR